MRPRPQERGSRTGHVGYPEALELETSSRHARRKARCTRCSTPSLPRPGVAVPGGGGMWRTLLTRTLVGAGAGLAALSMLATCSGWRRGRLYGLACRLPGAGLESGGVPRRATTPQHQQVAVLSGRPRRSCEPSGFRRRFFGNVEDRHRRRASELVARPGKGRRWPAASVVDRRRVVPGEGVARLVPRRAPGSSSAGTTATPTPTSTTVASISSAEARAIGIGNGNVA